MTSMKCGHSLHSLCMDIFAGTTKHDVTTMACPSCQMVDEQEANEEQKVRSGVDAKELQTKPGQDGPDDEKVVEGPEGVGPLACEGPEHGAIKREPTIDRGAVVQAASADAGNRGGKGGNDDEEREAIVVDHLSFLNQRCIVRLAEA